VCASVGAWSTCFVHELTTQVVVVDDPRRAALQGWLDRDVRIRFAGRLLAFDDGVAERWGQLEALAKKRRLTLPTIDAQLAATALHHGLTFVTRNTADIAPTGVPVFDPWK
jgi:predicted nucleic acid-binding protein